MAARAAATQTYLDFERPLEPLDAEIARLAGVSPGTPEGERLRRLRAERRRVQQELLARLTPWERVQLSRHPDRPSALDYLGVLCRDLVELHGDRRFGEDGAIVGGLGGALALALADRVLMQEHAWYSVISPEGCASILFRERTPETVARSAALLGLTAAELAGFGVVDEIVAEPGGGAHRQPARAAVLLGRALERHLTALRGVPPGELVAGRYARYRRIGSDLPAV